MGGWGMSPSDHEATPAYDPSGRMVGATNAFRGWASQSGAKPDPVSPIFRSDHTSGRVGWLPHQVDQEDCENTCYEKIEDDPRRLGQKDWGYRIKKNGHCPEDPWPSDRFPPKRVVGGEGGRPSHHPAENLVVRVGPNARDRKQQHYDGDQERNRQGLSCHLM